MIFSHFDISPLPPYSRILFYCSRQIQSVTERTKDMSLIPLTVYDNLRRVCCSVFASSSHLDVSGIAERLISGASLADVLRWRSVSRDFRRAAQKRLQRYTHLHVRVYEGLAKLYEKRHSEKKETAEDINWHPSSCLLLCEMDVHTIGIAVDAKPSWKDIRSLLAVLEVFRQGVEQVYMDSPVVEILVKEVNTKKVNALLYYFSQNRKSSAASAFEEHSIAPINRQTGPLGPLFPNLKHFTVTSNAHQLSHLSRLINYAVAVDMIYQKKEIDLVCLQVILGDSWCRSKQRLFRHVNSFKQWSDASSLGVKYLQQFQGTEKKRTKTKF